MMARMIAWKDFPEWAQATVLHTSTGGKVQIHNNGNVLQITGGIAFYNGKKVVLTETC